MILETRTKRPQWLSLHHVPPVDFMCEPCRLISLLANEQARAALRRAGAHSP